MRIESGTIERVSLGPGRHGAAWGTIDDREAFLLRLTDELGRWAEGEAAPISGFSDDSLERTLSSLEGALAPTGALLGANVERPEDIVELVETLELSPAAAHAVDQALLGLLALRADRSVASLLAANPRSAVPCHALVDSLESAHRAVSRGVTALKVKLGRSTWTQERQWLESIRLAVGPEVSLRADVNGAWSLGQAREAWPELQRLGVDLVEDPIDIRDRAGYRTLRELQGPRVAVDQGCTGIDDLQAWIAARALDVVVLKPMIIGGLQRARDLAQAAAQAGIAVMVTTCLESERGRQGALAVARAVPAGALEVCGLDPIASVWPGAEIIRGPIPNPVASSARAEPERAALVTAAASITWRELRDRAAKVAGGLKAAGATPGSVIALEGRPSARWVETFFGISWLGAIAAPVASAADPVALERLGATWVVSDAPGGVADGPWKALDLREDRDDGSPLTEQDWFLERPLVRLLTSGTTGTPTAVTLNTSQVFFGALGSTVRLGHDGEDRWLCCLPLHHIGGLAILCRAALTQTSVELHEGFDARRVQSALASGSIQLVSLVPEMLRRLLALDAMPSWPGLRAALIGGAACPPELLQAATEAGVPVSTTWGMTETAAQVATTAPGRSPVAGLPPLPFTRVLREPDGQLRVAGPQAGGRPLLSGDAGRIVDDHVLIEGRVDGVITSGALRIDPETVRQALLRQESIQEAHVLARPCPTWGARPVAALVPASRPEAASELRARLAEDLEGPQIPDAWVWVHELPRGPMGKVSGARVLELLEEAEPGETPTHLVGNRDRLEALHVHEDVNLAGARPDDPVLRAGEREGEGEASSPHGLDRHGDGQALVETHRPLEVGVGVDERHPPTQVVKDRRPGGIDREQQLLEGDVGVLKDPSVERDPSPINLMETNGDLVGESHMTSSANQSETPGVLDAMSLEGTR